MNKEMRKRREAAGLTMTALAQKSGVNYSTIQSLEAGRGAGFNIKYKMAVANALGADILDLFPELLKMLDYISGRGYVAEKAVHAAKGKGKK